MVQQPETYTEPETTESENRNMVLVQNGESTGGAAMTLREERMTILRMVEEGKISPEEGSKLLAAITENSETQAEATQSQSFDMSKSLRVRVTDQVTGKGKVNVSLPIGLVGFGLRFVPKSANIDVDAIQAALSSGFRGQIVDVVDEEDGTHVEVYIE